MEGQYDTNTCSAQTFTCYVFSKRGGKKKSKACQRMSNDEMDFCYGQMVTNMTLMPRCEFKLCRNQTLPHRNNCCGVNIIVMTTGLRPSLDIDCSLISTMGIKVILHSVLNRNNRYGPGLSEIPQLPLALRAYLPATVNKYYKHFYDFQTRSQTHC